MKDWPFDQEPNCAVISLKIIVFDGAPILYASHDEDDHSWQFMDGKDAHAADEAAVVTMSEIVERDPSVLAIADLPPGWSAWRETIDAPWHRARKVEE